MNTRAIANQIIQKVFNEQCPLNEAAQLLIPKNLQQQDKAFIKECCYGVTRWYAQLSHTLDVMLSRPLRKKDHDIYTLILIGLYQLTHMHVPAHAAVSETVNACVPLGKDWAKGLINGCLRKHLSHPPTLDNETSQLPSVSFSHPEWFIEKVKKTYPNCWKEILTANNEKPPLWLRINQKKTTTVDYLKLLEGNNISAKESPFKKGAILIDAPMGVEQLPHFFDGYISVQDIAGQFAASLLDIKKTHRVLDACAAPGSKTCQILEQSSFKKLVIIDKDAKRLLRIKDNINRLELDHSQTQLILSDASHTRQWWDGNMFDRILLDAPCSATGVIRRHPDIKWLKNNEAVESITQVQMQLIIALWKLLKKKGRLLYATCSVLPEENDQLISTFIAHHADSVAVPFSLPFGKATRNGWQCLPEKNGTDGFFYALLEKK